MNPHDSQRHCWQDRLDWVWQQGAKLGSPEYLDAIEHPATCMLPAGHAGLHAWTSDDDFVVEVAVLNPVDEGVIVVPVDPDGGKRDAG